MRLLNFQQGQVEGDHVHTRATCFADLRDHAGVAACADVAIAKAKATLKNRIIVSSHVILSRRGSLKAE
jgi:hypothetical protein